jgi:hypothetical protein
LKHKQPIKANFFTDAFNNSPLKMAIKRITCCQHIYELDLLHFFKNLGVADIYWSHKTTGQNGIEGIKFYPYPLYPGIESVKNHTKISRYQKEKFLYSFTGAYQPDLYLSKVHEWTFSLPKRDDAIVIERSEWYFEQYVMEETLFCLCPSGSGPNSIRLW